MAVLPTDIVIYGSLLRPEDDTTPSGGGIDVQFKPFLEDLQAPGRVVVHSDAPDLRQVTISGKDLAFQTIAETITLSGASSIQSAGSWIFLEKVTASGVDAARTITVMEARNGLVLGTIGPNELGLFRMFLNSVSAATNVTRYEKLFVKNIGASLWSNATVTLTVDIPKRLTIGLAAALDDAVQVANRLTAPPAIVFADDNVPLGIPGGQLPGGSAIGVWIAQGLIAGDGKFRTMFELEVCGDNL